MIHPPKPGQAIDLYLDWPPSVTRQPCGGYEIRAVSYMTILQPGPWRHASFSTDPGYWCETDTELDWEDRANADGGDRDWWDADWVRAAWRAGLGPYEGCDECDPFGDSFECVCL